MIASLLYALFLVVGFVSGDTTCWERGGVQSTVTGFKDLQTATAFTYVDAVEVYNCSTNTVIFTGTPTYYTTYYTAYIDGSSFPARNSYVFSIYVTTSTTFYESYTFPGLTVTSLTPGEAVSLVWTLFPSPPGGFQTGIYNIFVPTDALTRSSTSTISTTTTPTPGPTTTVPPGPTTPSSPVNIGAIVGGTVGGVVGLAAIAAFAWYLIRRPAAPSNVLDSQRDTWSGGPVEKHPVIDEYEQGNVSRDATTSRTLRYPEGEIEAPSGNTMPMRQRH